MLSSGAFAQTEWKDLVVNGNMEGEQNPKWSSFWCHDWRKGLGDFDPDSEQQYDNGDPEKSQPAQNVVFDLSGRRVQQATKGLYIINGKKYVVK